MSTTRDVQGSLFPDIAPDAARGPLLPSIVTGTNADVIVRLAPYYLRGSVLDTTWGEGAWWRRFQPADFTAHDLHTLDGVDFADLPHPDKSFDTVVFDPPYVPQSGRRKPAKSARFRERYGLENRNVTQLYELIAGGLAECARVVKHRGFIIVKCCDFSANRKLHLGHRFVCDTGEDLRMVVHDLLIHHSGAGMGGYQIEEPVRSRRHHSYFVVLRRPGR